MAMLAKKIVEPGNLPLPKLKKKAGFVGVDHGQPTSAKNSIVDKTKFHMSSDTSPKPEEKIEHAKTTIVSLVKKPKPKPYAKPHALEEVSVVKNYNAWLKAYAWQRRCPVLGTIDWVEGVQSGPFNHIEDTRYENQLYGLGMDYRTKLSERSRRYKGDLVHLRIVDPEYKSPRKWNVQERKYIRAVNLNVNMIYRYARISSAYRLVTFVGPPIDRGEITTVPELARANIATEMPDAVTTTVALPQRSMKYSEGGSYIEIPKSKSLLWHQIDEEYQNAKLHSFLTGDLETSKYHLWLRDHDVYNGRGLSNLASHEPERCVLDRWYLNHSKLNYEATVKPRAMTDDQAYAQWQKTRQDGKLPENVSMMYDPQVLVRGIKYVTHIGVDCKTFMQKVDRYAYEGVTNYHTVPTAIRRDYSSILHSGKSSEHTKRLRKAKATIVRRKAYITSQALGIHYLCQAERFKVDLGMIDRILFNDRISHLRSYVSLDETTYVELRTPKYYPLVPIGEAYGDFTFEEKVLLIRDDVRVSAVNHQHDDHSKNSEYAVKFAEESKRNARQSHKRDTLGTPADYHKIEQDFEECNESGLLIPRIWATKIDDVFRSKKRSASAVRASFFA